MTEARPTAEDNSNTITVVDRNGNTDSTKIEMIENVNINENQNEPIVRNSTRLRSANPIHRYGNPGTC